MFQEKTRIFYAGSTFLTLPRVRNINRDARALFVDGQFDDETTTGFVGGIEEEVATEILEMAFGECQSDAETFREVVDLGKHLKEVAHIFISDARTGILDDEIHLVVCTIDAHRDVLTIRIFRGIIEQFTETAHEVEAAGVDIEVIGHIG